MSAPLALMLLAKNSRPGDNFYGPDPSPDEPYYTQPLTDKQKAILALEKQRMDEGRAILFVQPETHWQAYLQTLRSFRNDRTRTTRRLFWGYLFYAGLFALPFALVDYLTGKPVLTGIYILLNLFPCMALQGRRINDAGIADIWKPFFRLSFLFLLPGIAMFIMLPFPPFYFFPEAVKNSLLFALFAAYACCIWIFLVSAFFESAPFINAYGPYPFSEKTDGSPE